MTDFQLSLLVIGGTFVVGIYAFNKWQEHKAKKSVEQAFSGAHDDVLMNPDAQVDPDPFHERQEPQLGSDLPNDDASPSITPVISESQPESQAQSSAQQLAVQTEKDLPVDELIDCIIALEFDSPIRGEKLLTEIGNLRFVGKKPVHFIGLGHDGQRDVIAHGGVFTTLFAGVQMVSRGGPLNELEFSEFVAQLREIGERLNAHSDIPDMKKVMSHSRDLHQFVSEHDAQLSVNILANGSPWAVNSLLVALEKQGFDVRPDGYLVMPDGDGGNLFTLSTNVSVSASTTSRLTLLLDVPCVAPDRNGFGAMSACARSLSIRLGGTVVDDGNNAISKEALDEIALQVNEFYAAMAEARIPAGSIRAQRLFS